MSVLGDSSSAVIPSRPELSQEFVVHHRRARFVAAAAEICHEFSPADVTTTTLCRVAGSSRNTFYDVFPNVEACLRQGLEEAAERLLSPLRQPPEGEWLPSLALALGDFYAAVAAEPLLAELLLIHSYSIEGARERDPVSPAVAALRPLLARGRAAAGARGAAPELSEELLAGAYLTAATEALRDNRIAELPAQARRLAVLAGDTFLGRAETERQLAAL